MSTRSTPAIYTGFWIEWNEGRIKGATLTLSNRHGAYLIAFLALFVHIAGSSFWRLSSFFLFRRRTHPGLHDKSALQQQAILRNGSSAFTALRRLATAAVLARPRQMAQRWGLLTWAIVSFAGFLAASTLSSKVSFKRSNVLLEPTNCGRWWEFGFNRPGGYGVASASAFVQLMVEQAATTQLRTTSHQYASVCGSDTTPRDHCLWFARNPIAFSTNLHAPCPFHPSICLAGKAFSVDSGWINSDVELGINGYPEDRIKMRINKTCAPLKRDGYTKMYDSTNISSIIVPPVTPAQLFDFPTASSNFEAFFYGPQVGLSNATFIYDSAARMRLDGESNTVWRYLLNTEVYQGCAPFSRAECASTFQPIPELLGSSQDITLIFLSSDVQYLGPVTDPWFDAQICDPARLFPDVTVCQRSSPTTVLGCVEETEMCADGTTEGSKCVKLQANGLPYDQNAPGWPNLTQLLNLSPRQASIASRLQDASYRSGLVDIVLAMGPANLLALQKLGAAYGTPLPEDQWTKEVENWFNTALVNMQLYNTQFVTGWQNAEANSHVTPPAEAEAWMCNAQVVQSNAFSSFSVLGLCTILAIGGVLITLELCLPRVWHRFVPSTPLNTYRKKDWEEFDLLEMTKEVVEK